MQYLPGNNILFSVLCIALLIITSVGLSYYNGHVLCTYNQTKLESHAILGDTDDLLINLQALDLGMREYALTQKQQPYRP